MPRRLLMKKNIAKIEKVWNSYTNRLTLRLSHSLPIYYLRIKKSGNISITPLILIFHLMEFIDDSQEILELCSQIVNI